MSIYPIVDAASDELLQAFHSLVPVVAEQAGVSEPDALYHLRRTLMDRLKGLKLSDRIDYKDDGRTATWRVRLQIWHATGGEEQASCVADTDPDKSFELHNIAPGATLVSGIPGVARWALEMIEQYHASSDPGCILDGMSEGVLASKIRSVRVSLSHGAGSCVWRLRYSVRAPAHDDSTPSQPVPGSLRGVRSRLVGLRHFRADVRIVREDRGV